MLPPVNSSQLWYAPFITASLGMPSPKDYVSLSVKNAPSETGAFYCLHLFPIAVC